jgi:hypothetical protein
VQRKNGAAVDSAGIARLAANRQASAIYVLSYFMVQHVTT